jgi:sugar/nucleoside kinase (ribokinase family)
MGGRVVVLGSLNVDLVTRVERHPRPGETVLGDGLEQLAGGKGANQAVAAAAAGASVAMVGCVGDDAGGAAYRRRLERLGIDVTGVRVCEGVPTGHAIVTVADSGENSIVVVPGANDLADEREVAAVDGLGPDDVLLVQLEVPRAVVCAAVRRAAGRGARVVLNTAPYAAPARCRRPRRPRGRQRARDGCAGGGGCRAAVAARHLRGQRGCLGRGHDAGARRRLGRGRRHDGSRGRVLRGARRGPGARRRPG